MSTESIPAVVLGAGGYVGAETIRLIALHPNFRLESAVSSSSAGKRIDEVFPHLAGSVGDAVFVESAAGGDAAAVFCAVPHGEARMALESWLSREGVHVVDMSADHRLGVSREFHYGLPDLDSAATANHVSHPGCFATAATLACAPLVEAGLVAGALFLSGVTGSTGSGAQAKAGTHHPTRNGAVWAYEPLRHRHTPEIRSMLSSLAGRDVDVAFVPHSGPFSRGIHMTVLAKAGTGVDASKVLNAFQSRYGASPFIRVGDAMPSVREVAGTNRCHIGVATDGGSIAVTAVIDNLVKGAAGGAMQWMNRLFGLGETAGLMTPGTGWA